MRQGEYLLETKRLWLRPFILDDDIHLFELNSDPLVIKYAGDPPFESVSSARTFLADYDQYEKYKLGRFSCISKQDGSYLGWCGLKYNADSEIKGLFDLGYRFHRKYWNQGYATESSKRILEYGFETCQLKHIMACAFEANKASIKVMKKIGLKYWKRDLYYEEEMIFYQLNNFDYLKNIVE